MQVTVEVSCYVTLPQPYKPPEPNLPNDNTLEPMTVSSMDAAYTKIPSCRRFSPLAVVSVEPTPQNHFISKYSFSPISLKQSTSSLSTVVFS
jgi:hypothetical protein